jgi:hypothetical protein
MFQLQLSAKSTGLFESFYSSLKPIIMIKEQKDIAGEGRITDKELNDKSEKKFPFSFPLKVLQSPCSFAIFRDHTDALLGSTIPKRLSDCTIHITVSTSACDTRSQWTARAASCQRI